MKQEKFFKRLIPIIIVILIFGKCDYDNWLDKSSIQKIENYKLEHGRYPEKLSDANVHHKRYGYETDSAGTYYFLDYVTVSFILMPHRREYDGREWRTD